MPVGANLTTFEKVVTPFPTAHNSYKQEPARVSLAPLSLAQALTSYKRWTYDDLPVVLGFPLEFHECTSKCGDVKNPCVGPKE